MKAYGLLGERNRRRNWPSKPSVASSSRYKKSAIKDCQQLKCHHAAVCKDMTTQELVDLVEY